VVEVVVVVGVLGMAAAACSLPIIPIPRGRTGSTNMARKRHLYLNSSLYLSDPSLDPSFLHYNIISYSMGSQACPLYVMILSTHSIRRRSSVYRKTRRKKTAKRGLAPFGLDLSTCLPLAWTLPTKQSTFGGVLVVDLSGGMVVRSR